MTAFGPGKDATQTKPGGSMTRRTLIAGFATLAALAALATPSFAAHAKTWGRFNGGTTAVFTPTPVAGLEEVVEIDASNNGDYFRQADGSVWAIGLNNRGQLGNGTVDSEVHGATKVHLPEGVTAVTLGEAEGEGAAIDTEGQGWVWGFNPVSSLCVKGNAVSTPVRSVSGATAVQGGEAHTLWLLNNGTVVACGQNTKGQLGNGTFTNSGPKPVAVAGLTEVVEVSAGEFTSCARTTSGQVFDWGGNEHGRLGNGTEVNSNVPVEVPLPGPATQISCGGNLEANGHSLALVGGQVYGWGADKAGQVGDVSEVDKLSPVATGILCSKAIAGGFFSMCLDGEGNVSTWGSGSSGALGTGNSKTQLKPVVVDSAATMISATAGDAVDAG